MTLKTDAALADSKEKTANSKTLLRKGALAGLSVARNPSEGCQVRSVNSIPGELASQNIGVCLRN